ncbi:MAG: hypothetical protein J4N81_12865, partial [Chloroflexi bacterium]|nr:hypothetical protein [Chloroflexota bacterium]
MSSRRRWTIFGTIFVVAIVAIAAVVVFLLLDNGTPSPANARVSVQEIINKVETDRRRETAAPISNFLPAQVGQDLMPGDGVKTFPDSEARVDILVNEFLRITRTTPNTVWRLGQFALDQTTIIELEQGKMFLLDEGFAAGENPVKVVTPAGTASPRGTWMSVGYDPKTGVTEVQCFRGTCELENDLGVQLLTDEQKSTVTAETKPTEPIFLAPVERQIFVELPEAKRGEVPIPTPSPTDTPQPAPTEEPTSVPTATPTVVPTLAPTAT